MRPGGGREKGAKAELEVAEILRAWWSQLEPGAKFVRTPGSGGWHGRNGREVRGEFRASGDLMTTATRFPFAVEVKKKEKWSAKTFVEGRPSPVHSWFAQAVEAAAELPLEPAPAVPLLVFGKNRVAWRCYLPSYVAEGAPHPFRPWCWQRLPNTPWTAWCWLSELTEIPPAQIVAACEW